MGILDGLLASGPGAAPAGAEEDDLGFLGMPKGYVPTRTPTPYRSGPTSPGQAERRATPQITPPRYKSGSEMEPRSYSPEMIARLQQQLVTAGLIGPDTRYLLGVWDQTSINAYKNLLGHANRGGMTREDALTELLTAPQVKGAQILGADGAGAQARDVQQGRLKTYEQSDPAGLRQTAEQAFRQALGRKPKKDELERFVSGFLGRERGSQDVVFKAQDALDEQNRQALTAAQGGGDMPSPDAGGGGSESDVLWDRLQQMVRDSPYKIGLGSRQRSYEEQVRLYNNWKAGKGPRAAKPGTSKHGDGRANDLKYSSDKARQWALENAHKYGLHFPIYDPSLPRSRDESWHVELKGGNGAPVPTQVTSAPSGPGGPVVVSDQSVTVQRQDAGAQALEYAQNQNPDEYQAYQIGGQFNSLVNILQRGVV